MYTKCFKSTQEEREQLILIGRCCRRRHTGLMNRHRKEVKGHLMQRKEHWVSHKGPKCLSCWKKCEFLHVARV